LFTNYIQISTDVDESVQPKYFWAQMKFDGDVQLQGTSTVISYNCTTSNLKPGATKQFRKQQ